MNEFIDLFLNLDQHLQDALVRYGLSWTYGILFLIIFCETGLVVTPFLPGDSLLFAAGMFAHPDKGAFNLPELMGLLMAASLMGDSTNYWIGRKFGMKLFQKEDSKIFKRSHLTKTREFFDKHGAKTIIIGRFVPFVRTFAPFVAGLDSMEYPRFLRASIVGAVTWVSVCTLAGYLFGQIKWVEDNFSIAIIGVVLLSFIGIIIEAIRARAKRRK